MSLLLLWSRAVFVDSRVSDYHVHANTDNQVIFIFNKMSFVLKEPLVFWVTSASSLIFVMQESSHFALKPRSSEKWPPAAFKGRSVVHKRFVNFS